MGRELCPEPTLRSPVLLLRGGLTMAHWKTGIAALGIAALTATAALAQTGAGPKDPNMPDPKSVPAEKVAPPLDTNTTGSTGSLSKRLEATEGVIKPGPTGDTES